jgi:uncharacterized protein YdcH (DUF465 family)
MEPYEQEQWNQLDRRLAEAEKKLLATANLVKGGIPMVVSQQMRIDALIDSDARLYLQMQQLIESQQRTDEKFARLADSQQRLTESQQRTDEKFARLAESQQQTDEKVARLADTVQKFVDSLKSPGNGAH